MILVRENQHGFYLGRLVSIEEKEYPLNSHGVVTKYYVMVVERPNKYRKNLGDTGLLKLSVHHKNEFTFFQQDGPDLSIHECKEKLC